MGWGNQDYVNCVLCAVDHYGYIRVKGAENTHKNQDYVNCVLCAVDHYGYIRVKGAENTHKNETAAV